MIINFVLVLLAFQMFNDDVMNRCKNDHFRTNDYGQNNDSLHLHRGGDDDKLKNK